MAVSWGSSSSERDLCRLTSVGAQGSELRAIEGRGALDVWTAGSTQACCCAYFSLRVLRSYRISACSQQSRCTLPCVSSVCSYRGWCQDGKRIAIPTSYYIVHVEIPGSCCPVCECFWRRIGGARSSFRLKCSRLKTKTFPPRPACRRSLAATMGSRRAGIAQLAVLRSRRWGLREQFTRRLLFETAGHCHRVARGITDGHELVAGAALHFLVSLVDEDYTRARRWPSKRQRQSRPSSP